MDSRVTEDALKHSVLYPVNALVQKGAADKNWCLKSNLDSNSLVISTCYILNEQMLDEVFSVGIDVVNAGEFFKSSLLVI